MVELTDAEAVEIVNKAIKRFKGDVRQLTTAIGVFMLGRKLGWRPTYLLHSTRTLRKYEGFLDVKFREVLPEEGPKSKTLVAWKIAKTVSNFWKLAKGETPEVRTSDWSEVK